MDPGARLLELQRLDLELDRLRARQRDLEAGGEVNAARSAADAAEAELGEHRLRLSAMDRDGTKLEHEIDSLRQRSQAEERRLYDGSIANAKELGSIQHEVESLGRRVSDREDELLALMEQREQVDALAVDASARAAELRERLSGVMVAAEDEARAVAGDLEERAAARAGVAQLVDGDVLGLYEDLRRQKKGVAVAELVDGVCLGCHEQLSASELDRVRRTDGLKRCEHCRRILVSGPR